MTDCWKVDIRVSLSSCLLLISILLATPVVFAAEVDLHRLWDDRCAECHGHAGEFSRSFLKVSDGQLQGRHHVNDLRQFLHNHYLPEREVDAVYNMLLAQASIPPRFSKECSQCHQTAANFVRNSFELVDGQLYSRRHGGKVRNFLDTHMGMSSSDAEFFEKLLTRVAKEVYRK